MKDIPQKFLDALKKMLNKDNKEAERLASKLETDPDKSAELVSHHLGSQTGPIKLFK
jgi:hypothetical protein